jgi:hypothetical protein
MDAGGDNCHSSCKASSQRALRFLPPDPGLLKALHHCLAAGDTHAGEQSCEISMPWLIDKLSVSFWHTDGQLILDAVTEALLEFLESPQSFDPALGERLDVFLEGRARQKLGHLLRGEIRRKSSEARAAKEQPTEVLAHLPGEETEMQAMLETGTVCDAVRQGLSCPLDRELFFLWDINGLNFQVARQDIIIGMIKNGNRPTQRKAIPGLG